MKKFEKINAGNVTLVKSAIVNKKALILLDESLAIVRHGISSNILDDTDICSLYDHDNLIIYRDDDSYFIGQLSMFYMKDKDNVIIVVTTPSRPGLRSRLEKAGYSSSDEIWIKMENLFDKCDELQENLDKVLRMKEKEDISKSDDIFEIFGDDEAAHLDSFIVKGKPVNGKNPLSFEGVIDSLFKQAFMKLNNCEAENNDNETKKELKEEFKNFTKEHGRYPSEIEMLDLMMEKKIKGKADPKEYEKLKEFAHIVLANPLASLMFAATLADKDKK